jgi:hypothetical protein
MRVMKRERNYVIIHVDSFNSLSCFHKSAKREKFNQ